MFVHLCNTSSLSKAFVIFSKDMKKAYFYTRGFLVWGRGGEGNSKVVVNSVSVNSTFPGVMGTAVGGGREKVRAE